MSGYSGLRGWGSSKYRNNTHPDVDLLVESNPGLDVEELGRAVGHGTLFRCDVLLHKCLIPVLDGNARLYGAAKVHEDWCYAIVGDHDIAVKASL